MSTSCLVPVELKNILKYKEELLTDMKNLLYRRSDGVELLAKQLEDANQQLVQCMRRIKKISMKLLKYSSTWWTL
jgi:hypothetical protein